MAWLNFVGTANNLKDAMNRPSQSAEPHHPLVTPRFATGQTMRGQIHWSRNQQFCPESSSVSGSFLFSSLAIERNVSLSSLIDSFHTQANTHCRNSFL